MTDAINLIFTIIVLILAVAAGLWFGHALADSGRSPDGRRTRRGLAPAIREVTSSAVVKLWKWRRAVAKRQRRDDERA